MSSILWVMRKPPAQAQQKQRKKKHSRHLAAQLINHILLCCVRDDYQTGDVDGWNKGGGQGESLRKAGGCETSTHQHQTSYRRQAWEAEQAAWITAAKNHTKRQTVHWPPDLRWRWWQTWEASEERGSPPTRCGIPQSQPNRKLWPSEWKLRLGRWCPEPDRWTHLILRQTAEKHHLHVSIFTAFLKLGSLNLHSLDRFITQKRRKCDCWVTMSFIFNLSLIYPHTIL